MATSAFEHPVPARPGRGIHWEITSGHLIYRATDWDGETVAMIRVPLGLLEKRDIICLLEDVLNVLAPRRPSALSEAPEWQRPAVLRLVPS
jgi:hypothetical protein